MSSPTCDSFFTCDEKHISLEQVMKMMIVEDENGCPVFKTKIINAPLPQEAENPVKGYAKEISNTSLTEVLPGQGVGVKNYINQILVTNSSTTTGTIVDIIEETTGDIIATGHASPEGGFSCSYPTAQPQSTANKKIYAKCTTAGASVTVSVSGYKK